MSSSAHWVLDAFRPKYIILALELAYDCFSFSHLKINKREYKNINSHIKTNANQAKIWVLCS